MALLALPKIPKLTDLIPLLEDLDRRITSLETYVTRNDERITALEQERVGRLEHEMAEHQAGAVHRQREMNRLRDDQARTRWEMRRRRRL